MGESIQEYRDITELDASTLNRLIKEIVVHETIGSDKTRHISIEIHLISTHTGSGAGHRLTAPRSGEVL